MNRTRVENRPHLRYKRTSDGKLTFERLCDLVIDGFLPRTDPMMMIKLQLLFTL